jgi:hypothetical protein
MDINMDAPYQSQPADVSKVSTALNPHKRWSDDEIKKVKEILAAHIEAENNGVLPPMDMKQMWQLVSEKLKEHGFTRSASAIEARFRQSVATERPPVARAGPQGLGVSFPNSHLTPDVEAMRPTAWKEFKQKTLFELLKIQQKRNISNEEKNHLRDTYLWKLISGQLRKYAITRSRQECEAYWHREGEALYNSQAGQDQSIATGIAESNASQVRIEES